MAAPKPQTLTSESSFQQVLDPAPGPSAAPAIQQLVEAAVHPSIVAIAPESRPPGGRTAVIVVHGMGQQLPFETLDAVVEGLRRVAQNATKDHAVRLARVGGADLARAELTLQTHADKKDRAVHLYEAYWAPLTEGRVTLRDVWNFLVRAALDGWRNARRFGGGKFRRWMFGTFVEPPVARKTSAHLLLAVLVLGSLYVINAATAALFAATVLHQNDVTWISPGLVADVTGFVACGSVAAAVFAWLMLATRQRALFFAALFAVLLTAVAVVAIVILHATSDVTIATLSSRSWLANPWLTGVFWTWLTFASLFVRRLLVQYVGDVAAYITPQRLDRFFELRQQIKEAVRKVAAPVYGHREAGRFYYDSVAIVGHSLGSVAAYDVLNGLVNADNLGTDGALDVVARTSLLLTFGSPLDKTAFIFSAQGHETRETREALAAAVQPLIQDYKFRTFPWVNVSSPADIISGKLDYYDDPSNAASKTWGVKNKIDPEANTPLVAHVEYWKNALVFTELHEALVRTREPAP